jgi:hypothetical protein
MKNGHGRGKSGFRQTRTQPRIYCIMWLLIGQFFPVFHWSSYYMLVCTSRVDVSVSKHGQEGCGLLLVFLTLECSMRQTTIPLQATIRGCMGVGMWRALGVFRDRRKSDRRRHVVSPERRSRHSLPEIHHQRQGPCPTCLGCQGARYHSAARGGRRFRPSGMSPSRRHGARIIDGWTTGGRFRVSCGW